MCRAVAYSVNLPPPPTPSTKQYCDTEIPKPNDQGKQKQQN